MAISSTITSIVTARRKPSHATIHIDGKAVATLPLSLIERLALKAGAPWNDATATQVSAASRYADAWQAAMKHLNRRAASRQELGHKLEAAGRDPQAVHEVLDRLEQLGALDDEALGRALIDEARSKSAAGPALLRQKLQRRGLDDQMVDRMLEQATEREDPVESALALARQRAKSMSRLDPLTRARRLWGALQRRGFDEDTIEQVMQRMEQEGTEAGETEVGA